MSFRTLFGVLLLLLFGFLDRTFFSGLGGGRWVIDTVFVAALIHITTFETKSSLLWIFIAASISEIFNDTFFGAGFVSVLVGLIGSRVALYGIFSHRSFVARAVCGIAGVVLWTGARTAFRWLGDIISGANAWQSGSMLLEGTGEKGLWTGIFFLCSLFFFLQTQGRIRWFFKHKQLL